MGEARRDLRWLVPGLASLRRGRWVVALGAFLPWAACLSVLLIRGDRVLAAVRGESGDLVAVGTLLLGIALPWLWSYGVHEARRHPGAGGPAGPSARAAWGWRAFLANRVAVAGLFTLGAVTLAILLAPLLAPTDPSFQGSLLTERLAPPSWDHPLGTDRLARDVLSRVLYGGRVTLTIALLAVGISVTIGTAVGATAGYVGGWVESALMRFVDVVLAFPRLVLLVAVVAVVEPSVGVIVLVLGLTQWPGTARIVHGEVLAVREREYVLAARALGFGGPRILLRHVIPNVVAPVIVTATLGVGNTIVLEAGLSFLSLGPPPPIPSWGAMVESGQDVLRTAWWLSFFPGMAIVLTVLSLNLVGDGLRDALDPRMGGDR